MIIRKLSFNPVSTANGSSAGDQSPTNNGHGLNNRITAKYVLHKNCTPTRCKVQPRDGTLVDDGAVEGWMAPDSGGFHPLGEDRSSNPSPPPIPETQNNYKLSRSMKNLPKKRTNITSNKNVNLRKCFRLRSKTFDGPLTVEGQAGGSVRTAPDGALASTPSIAMETGSVAAERREVVAAADSMTLASNNSSSRLIGAKLDKISKSLMRAGGDGESSLDIAKPLFLSASKHRRSNYNHIEGCDDEDMVIRGDDGLLHGHWRQEEELVLTSATGTTSFGRREPRLEQETTLSTMVEEEGPAGQTPSVMERLTVAETAAALLFEKVKYDRTKRYLIDQLTDGSGGSGGGGERIGGATPPSSSSCCSSPFHLAKSEDFVDPWKNYNIRGGTSWDKVSKSPWDSSAKPSPVRGEVSKAPLCQVSVEIPSQQHTVVPSYQPMRSHWNPFEYSPAHLARLAAATNSQQTSPSPKQPGAPQKQQYRPAFQVQTDVWENLNSKHYEIDTDVVWRSTRCSSRRTSASTVETWIDDETFDNSFNEELERRCATLKICE
uniref:Uncharacterized protein n=1 Tax=Anopheles epiroticus TaxID=199890 RepID=A0A182PQH7_9DIPT